MKDFYLEFRKMFLANKNIILKFIMAIYSYWCIISIMNLKGSYNVFLIFILIAIVYLFLKSSFDKSIMKCVYFASAVCSLAIAVGSKVALCIDVNSFNIFYFQSCIHIILLAGGLFIFFVYFFSFIFNKLKKINLLVDSKRLTPNKIFLVSLAIILLMWLPYYIRYFPGLLSLDSRVQLHYIEDVIFQNNHPFVQTWFQGVIYNFGKLIFHNNNLAMGFYTFIQMFILASIFAYAIRFLYKNKFNSMVIIVVLGIYALLPQFTTYAVTLWKDVLFGGAMLLLLIIVATMVMEEKIRKGNLFIFIIAVLMIMFFRNNGIYVILFCFPFFLYSFKNNIKTVGVTLVSLIGIYFIITGPVYSYIGVGKSNAVESSAIPLQQVARVIARDEKLSSSEDKYLKTIFNYDEIKSVYKPSIVDPVKNHADKEKFDKTKVEFYKVWLSMSYKHPKTYIEAYLSQTLGYWYPSVKYWTTIWIGDENTYGVYNVDILPKSVNKVIDATKSLDLTFSSLFWGIGFGVILIFLSIILSIIRKVPKNKYIAFYIPCIGLWLTMMVASPVYAEYRYVYGLFTSLPILVLLPFIIKSTKK